MRAPVHFITLDEYISFLENPSKHDLTNKHMNQIISMHGFKKLHRRPKKVLLDALNSVELLMPFRSTLKENISSSASLTTDEVIRDLGILEWQECSLRSIERLSSTKENLSKDDEIQASNLNRVKPKPKVSSGTTRVGKWGAKRKRKAMKAGSASTVTSSATANLPFSSSLSL